MRSRSAAVSTIVLVASGLGLVAGPPAQATSDPQSYVCTVGGSTSPVTTTGRMDSNAPAEIFAGTTRDVSVTSLITLPPAVVDSLRAGDATAIGGSGSATVAVNNADSEVPLTIAATALPAAGSAMVLTGSGPAGTVGPQEPNTSIGLWIGHVSFQVGRFLTGGSSAGAPVTITCDYDFTGRPDGVLIDVVAKPTTVSFVDLQPVEFGARPKVTVAIGTPGWNGKPDGWVDFNLDGVKVTVPALDGRATATLPATSRIGSQSLGALFRPADPYVRMKYHDVALTVVRAETRSEVTLIHRPARHRLVVKDVVTAVYGTAVAGAVRLDLRRNGEALESTLVVLSSGGKLHHVFKHVRKPGKYVVVATYKGSQTLRNSIDRARVKF